MPLNILKERLAPIAVRDSAAQPLVAESSRAARGSDLEVTVPSTAVGSAARVLDEAAFTLESITGVDWLAEQQMEVVYDYTCFRSGERVTVRTRIPRDKPELPTISDVFPGANWHEREAHDFFGILFAGHPQLTPLLLPEDALFHPLRKDFTA